VSLTSSAARTTAACRAAGSATTTMTAGTIRMKRAAVRAAFEPLPSRELAVQCRGEQSRSPQPLCLLVPPATGGSIRLAGSDGWVTWGAAFSAWAGRAWRRALASLVLQPGLGCWLFPEAPGRTGRREEVTPAPCTAGSTWALRGHAHPWGSRVPRPTRRGAASL